jgi:hypothetical protein
MYRWYVDIGGSVRASDEVATEIEEAALKTGLVINESEEKYIKININTTKRKI